MGNNVKLLYYTDVTNGLFQKNVTKRIKEDLKFFEGKRIEISISRKYNKRSLKQNGLYWAYVDIISTETGQSKEDLHEMFIKMFNAKPLELVNKTTGELIEGFTYQRTKDMTTIEMMEMTDKLRVWAAEFLGIVLPDPGDQQDFSFAVN